MGLHSFVTLFLYTMLGIVLGLWAGKTGRGGPEGERERPTVKRGILDALFV